MHTGNFFGLITDGFLKFVYLTADECLVMWFIRCFTDINLECIALWLPLNFLIKKKKDSKQLRWQSELSYVSRAVYFLIAFYDFHIKYGWHGHQLYLVALQEALWGIICSTSWHICFYKTTISSVTDFISSVWSGDDRQISNSLQLRSLQNLPLNYCLLRKNILESIYWLNTSYF